MEVSRARVDVRSWLNGGHDIDGVTGKIVTLIGDVRVGRVTLSNNNEQGINVQDRMTYQVTVPVGRVLHLEVDREIIDSNNQRVKHLELFRFANGILGNNHVVHNHEVNANIQWDGENVEVNGEQHFITTDPEQPQRPVEVKMVSGHLTVVYTIGDEMSFTEFIMALRRLLADHGEREDIMDRHDFLNLSVTREHPLLPKTPLDPAAARWIHIKLQVVEPDRGTWWTTLLMRDDDLYVHGFINQQGDCYELLDNENAAVHLLPQEYNPQRLVMGLSYRSLLGGPAIATLIEANLGRNFAVEAVRVLSSHPVQEPGVHMSVGKALAGLIFLTCESARMNPVHDSFAEGGWSDGNGFTEQLMRRYVWHWSDMSWNLRSWKGGNYKNPQRVISPQDRITLSAGEMIQATYLVLNSRWQPPQGAGGSAATKTKTETSKPSSGGYSGDRSKKDSGGPSSRPGGGGGPSSRPGGSGGPRTRPGGGGGPSSRPGGSGGQGDDPMAPRRRPPRRRQDKDSGKSPVDEDEDKVQQGHGRPRPRVELLTLAMHPDFLVDGVKVVVFDGKRGQIIYRKDEQEQRRQEEKGQGGQQEMVDLVLTGPYRGISAEYGCFAIKFDSNKHPPSKWEWDCDDPDHAAQVDTMQPAQGTITTSDGQKVAEVTYAVMSDAREATVKVKLQLKSGLSPVGASGTITALIDGFDVPSVLFSCTEEMSGNCLSSSTDGDSWFLLQLARNVVAVPCSRVLHIHVNLQIETDDGMRIELEPHLSFDNGTRSSKPDNGNDEVQVEVTWYPQQITSKEADEMSIQSGGPPLSEVTTVSEEYETEVTFTIRDVLSFLSFIKDLRRVAANHRDQREDILDRHQSNLGSTRDHPVLPKLRRDGQPARWLHVKLEAVQGNETWSTTLAMRDDDLCVEGFRNQQGVWYGLAGDPNTTLPPDEYSPEILRWADTDYNRILRARDSTEVRETLAAAEQGRDFVMHAVRRLSSSDHPDDKVHGLMSARLALAGLIFMVCDSARLNPVLDSIAGGWSTGMGFDRELVIDSVWKYPVMSRKLLDWKRRNYAEPIPYAELRAVHLVLNM